MAISATLTVFNAPYGIDQTNARMVLRGNLAWAAGTYAAGGVTPNAPPYLDAAGASVLIPTLNVQPDTVTFQSVSGSGYTYKRNKATGKIQVFQVAGFTPAGTNSAPALTMNSYTPAGTITNGTPDTFAGTPAVLTGTVAAPTFTGSAVAAGALSELANGALPAAVVADVIEFEASWVRD
jgi:hypothetical protein